MEQAGEDCDCDDTCHNTGDGEDEVKHSKETEKVVAAHSHEHQNQMRMTWKPRSLETGIQRNQRYGSS